MNDDEYRELLRRSSLSASDEVARILEKDMEVARQAESIREQARRELSHFQREASLANKISELTRSFSDRYIQNVYETNLHVGLSAYREFAERHNMQFADAANIRNISDKLLETMGMSAYAHNALGISGLGRDLLERISPTWAETFDRPTLASLDELYFLSSSLKTASAFDDAFSVALRSDLGDWRKVTEIPPRILADPNARVEFYIAQGFNESLTSFDDEIFEDSIVVVGLYGNEEPLDSGFELPNSLRSRSPEEEIAFQRMMRCHSFLMRLERRLRERIHEEMSATYGPEWPQQKLPPQTLAAWRAKREHALKSGIAIGPLIDAADFTDYEPIITRRDSWREVFEKFFRRPESVRESFQRLYPIRLSTSHGRFVTKEDEIYVASECTRLMKVFDSPTHQIV